MNKDYWLKMWIRRLSLDIKNLRQRATNKEKLMNDLKEELSARL